MQFSIFSIVAFAVVAAQATAVLPVAEELCSDAKRKDCTASTDGLNRCLK
ncbi:hypothetical protein MCOR25_001530 [Pyricularia grisea]|nr:hypothetical protein MCOR25_001530 [Pyricularia grisea]